MTTTRVYRYGCPSWADLDETGIRQLRLAHTLQNRLVEIDLHADRLRQQTESKARQHLIERARRADIKRARQHLAAQGLHWGTYGAVIDTHDTARRRIIQTRIQGRPAQFRFRRWDGEGRLRVVLMQQAQHIERGQRRTPDMLAADPIVSAWPWRNVAHLHIDPTPRRRTHALLTVRICADKHAIDGHTHVTVPIVYHRPLPPDSEIVHIEIVRRRIGTQHRIHVCFTVRLPDRPTVDIGSRGVVAVRTRWAHVTGGILTATVAGHDLPPPPDSLTGIVQRTGSHTWDVIAPDTWQQVLRRDDDIRSIRDDHLNSLRGNIVQALKDTPNLTSQLDIRGHVAAWRAPRRFHWLAQVWPDGHPLKPTLLEWRRQDRHLWDFEANERAQVVARRRDAWRKVAAWICGPSTGQVVVHNLDIATIRATAGDNEWAAAAGNRNIQQAAPGELRAAICDTAAREHIEIVTATETTDRKETA